jgi:hypothetical protein
LRNSLPKKAGKCPRNFLFADRVAPELYRTNARGRIVRTL